MKTTFKQLFSILFFAILITACSKKTDSTVVANQNVVGTWLKQSTTGSAIVGGKTIDLSKSTDYGFIDIQTLIFKSDGTGTTDGDAFTYTISGNTLTMKQTGFTGTMNVVVDNKTLTLKADETGLAAIIALFNSFDPTNKVTKLSQTTIFKAQ